MVLTLLSYAGDFRALKALIAAKYNGVELAQPAFQLGKDNTTAEFLAKNPTGKVPVLETPQGVIFESNAIARYVARIRGDTELLGKSFFEGAQVDAWLDFSSHELELPLSLWTYPLLGWAEAKPAVQEKAAADTHKALSVLEKHLLSKTYMVGEAITLADIVLVAALLNGFKLVFDAEVRETYPSLTRWFHTCVNQPAFAAVLGEVSFAGEGQAASAKAAAPKKEKKAAEPKKEEKKKEEKKPAKKEEEEEADLADELTREAPKSDPFAHLPKSTMVLDEWKRTYSNSKDDFYASMPWFWANLDKAGYTLWSQKYNYNAECTSDFRTSNLMGGFMQRTDEVRRAAFGVMHALHVGKIYEVEGIWLMRGDDIKPMLDCNPDAEYYTWTKMNPDDAAVQAKVGECWCTMTTFDGKEVYDSKVFK